MIERGSKGLVINIKDLAPQGRGSSLISGHWPEVPNLGKTRGEKFQGLEVFRGLFSEPWNFFVGARLS
ncbi:MAG TPA: hypothetical protein PKA21_16755, partial [Kiritimatiellia bacterium]|nr:hypothetical protein [Kiritimatiellia bacterium]